MNKLILILFSFSILGCHTYNHSDLFDKELKKRNKEPLSKIIISHQSCTECLDAYIEKGKVFVPLDLKQFYGDTLINRDVILVGNFPLDLLDINKKFEIQGKLILNDKNNLTWSNAPIFYVINWKKINPKK
ncbi:MAG: hypothetical protein KA275_08685 [Chitinophagaceae bacterium]|nr:hypothetical protein [Chitinophagaceae bacterium]